MARLALLLAAASLGCSKPDVAPGSYGLDCIFAPRAPFTECARSARAPGAAETARSASSDLVIGSVRAGRGAKGLVLDVHLEGQFWNEADQNLYVFVGGSTPGGASSSYALTADPGHAAESGYPVRSTVELPHSSDLRIGIMAPAERRYSPQVYVNDPVRAEAVGRSSGVQVATQGGDVHLEIPIERYYAAKRLPVPEVISVTVATARDYVGFIDQLSVRDVAKDGERTETTKALPPMPYPMIDARSHVLERVTLRPASGGVSVEVGMAAPIRDWAQTNLSFYFIPVPPYRAGRPLPDPTTTRTLPYRWSYYCGVYSPRRVFCKASHGKDFSFDSAYSERTSLALPEGIAFRDLGEGRYALDVAAALMADIRLDRPTFAVVVAAGRDGDAPTSWYGAPATAQSATHE